jgi:luciferase family oxidoreductase group 1
MDLRNYLHDTADPGTIQQKIRAIPQVDTVPSQWLLSSSGQSALFAAHFGMGFSFAHFINPVGGPQAVKLYRDRYQPSDDLPEPEANMAIFVFCSDDPEKIAQHKAVMDARFLQFEKGVIFPLSYDDVKDAVYTDAEQDRIRYNRQRVVAGNPEMVKNRLSQLAESYDLDELMIVTICEDFQDRLRSYELLAEMFELEKAE